MDIPSTGLCLLFTGSRTWRDSDWIMQRLGQVVASCRNKPNGPRRFVLMHGDCAQGGDAIAREIWVEHWGLEEDKHPAKWHRFGRPAGQIRNAEMVAAACERRDEGWLVICEAFIRDRSPGASRCSEMALEARIPTKIHVAGSRPAPKKPPAKPGVSGSLISLPAPCARCSRVTTLNSHDGLDGRAGECLGGCYGPRALAEAADGHRLR